MNEEDIRRFVTRFYADIRDDQILGPIFEEEMEENWDAHIEKMCGFWETVLLGKARYKGNPLEAHRKIAGLNDAHFDRWLCLFRQTLEATCREPSHVELVYGKAEMMARTIKKTLTTACRPGELRVTAIA